ncbi:tRNA lysidine(34) synthetase TilS [Mycoplasmatota bacterium]|nr:tRNA lysidine(34) synthetase TilS [Mycoplasmatota bacterium]
MIKNFNNNLIEKGDHLVLSVSGGLDSMVLLDYIYKLKKDDQLTLHVAHIDHKKRQTSHKDADFVKIICESLKVPFYLYEIDDEDYDNFHDFAHKKRYNFLYHVAKQVRASKIVLAHHQDDLAETILMRLVRGSSFEGYRGILDRTFYKDMEIIRPFLNVPKSVLKAYQMDSQVKYREDESNQENLYTRNRFRHKIMPLLENENPKYLDKFSQFSDYQDKAYAFIYQHAQSYFHTLNLSKDKIMFNTESFKKEYDIIQMEVLKLIINHLTDNSLELSYQNILDIIELINNTKSHVQFEIKDHLYVYKNYQKISVQTYEESANDYEYLIDDFGNYTINKDLVVNLSKKPNKNYDYIYELCYNNLDLVFPIIIRNRRPGDRLNIKIGTKKLKDFFIDKKVPMIERNRLPLIINKNSEILYIPGLFKLNTSGTNSIYIQIKKTKT